jgi:hypothetical protein
MITINLFNATSRVVNSFNINFSIQWHPISLPPKASTVGPIAIHKYCWMKLTMSPTAVGSVWSCIGPRFAGLPSRSAET